MFSVADISSHVFTASCPAVYQDPRMRQFLDYVKRMEKDIYLKSRTVEDYYKQMATQYQCIYTELQEKHRLRTGQAQRLNGEEHEDHSMSTDDFSHIEQSATKQEQDKVTDALAIISKEDDGVRSTTHTNQSIDSNASSIADKVDEKLSKTVESPTSSTSSAVGVTRREDLASQQAASAAASEDHESSTILKETESKVPHDSKMALEPSQKPSTRRIWYPNELLQHFSPLIDTICKEKNAVGFLEPVDCRSHELRDYAKRVPRPMDLSTIRKKLTDREYETPWDIVHDFWLMLNNAWSFNKKQSKIYKQCTKVCPSSNLFTYISIYFI